ncbi:MAG: GNAT family N-acetyltransferase [Alphaproteobacteria bacterium GM202ARS2]|nr:GNAT family N-acetyltransferase [Alphaproteobacteria bacterium GM202ARS2]
MRLETPRLLIESFELSDVDDYAEIVADPNVMRYLNRDGSSLSRSEAKEYVENCIESERQHGFARYAVKRHDTSELIGMCGFKQMPDYVDLGFRYAKAYWRKGYGFEAAAAVINYGFSALNLPEIVAIASKKNTGSIRIIQKLGFVFKRHILTANRVDSVRYHRLR